MRILIIYLMITAISTVNASAITLGEIELDSFYNEPLNARIPVIQFGQGNTDITEVAVADKFAFASAGIDRLDLLGKLDFSLKGNAPHGQYIHITSKEVVNELYLDFILDVSSDSQRLSKNITVLIDPKYIGRTRSQSKPVRTRISHNTSPTKIRSNNSHGMEATVDKGNDSHSMESHSMEATVDKGNESHSMESHSMEATVDKGNESHSMESHSMEATVDKGNESHSMESHSMDYSSSL